MFMFVGHFLFKKEESNEEEKEKKVIREKKFPGQKGKLWAKIWTGD